MADVNSSIIFIPDISGFTKFVNDTEISHSRHIISELLENIINSDILDMKVSEIEGDAILFYMDEIPLLDELIKQCENTFKRFHSHLNRYDTERICRCGACETASNLSLKFVIHLGQVGKINVKEHEKLHGSDVILAHRLLKNSIPEQEYILVSENIKFSEQSIRELKSRGYSVHDGKEEYENAGSINYSYIGLSQLHNEIPQAPAVTFPDLSPQTVSFHITIDAPIDQVYESFTNFEKRVEWNEDIKDIILQGDRLNSSGSLHTCLVGPYWLDIESLGREDNEDTIIYGERLNKFKGLRDIISIFTFEKVGTKTKIKAEVDFKIKSFFGRLMKPAIKRMLQKQTESGLQKLKKVSEKNN